MIRLFGWFAFAAVAYGSALVVLTPASYLAGLAPDSLKPFIRDASGSVWSGQISIGPANDSRVDLSWRFSPKALAKACALFTVTNLKQGAQALVRGEVTVCPVQQSVTVTNFDVHTSMARWVSLTSHYVQDLRGDVAMTLPRVEWSGDQLRAQGRLVWREAYLDTGSSIALGEVTGDVGTEGKGVQVRVENFNGEISLSARLLVNPDGSYQLNGTVDPRDNIDVANAMEWAGTAAPGGGYLVRFVGRL